ncbi:hypothetical protein [Paraburkholderia fungorum]|uniref:Preprotein translocase subunit SecA n=1 Tax=Paraburkholderia fungorum TaxID=134537 RepID=A0AAW3V4H7_9BURK|nr:hypothetical protein [Paraburkholderia fungorum]MBB4517494.1 hypothetical protein [Paraburkholderia fungorum]MBB6204562.1 hypothetical protein [Paraburkholderia fungorum]
MLSPHEFATLMLVKDTPDPIELDHADLESLVEHQLVSLVELGSGRQAPRITIKGCSILEAVERIR